jgi:hypothetical protein
MEFTLSVAIPMAVRTLLSPTQMAGIVNPFCELALRLCKYS